MLAPGPKPRFSPASRTTTSGSSMHGTAREPLSTTATDTGVSWARNAAIVSANRSGWFRWTTTTGSTRRVSSAGRARSEFEGVLHELDQHGLGRVALTSVAHQHRYVL